MKRLIISGLTFIFSGFATQLMAQEDIKISGDNNTEEQIIIRRKGAKDAKVTVEIKGDKVFIDGKPLSEYKGDDISIRKKKIIVRDSDGFRSEIFREKDDHDAFIWNSDDAMERGFLGVTTEKDNIGAKIIEDVSKETPAGKAGLEKGDIIFQVNDEKIAGPQDLQKAISSKKPKEEVKIRYRRNGKDKTMKVVLGAKKTAITRSFSFDAPDGSFRSFTMPAMPPLPPLPPDEPQINIDGDFFMTPEMSENLRDLDFATRALGRRQKLGLKIQDTEEGTGVKILEVADSSAGGAAGLKKDDVIIEIGGKSVKNTDEAREELRENSDKSSYGMKARRGGSEMSFTIKIPKKLKTVTL